MPYGNPYSEHEYFEIDENFEFNKDFNKLIDQEVEKRVVEKTESIQKDIEKGENDSKIAGELRSEITELKRQLIFGKKNHMKEGATKERMKLLGGYDFNQIVWFIKGEYTYTNCETCEGKGTVIATIASKDVKIECPKCNGFKKKGAPSYSPQSGCIIDMFGTLSQREDKCRRTYTVSYSDNPKHRNKEVDKKQDEIYKTEEECLKVIEEKNRTIKNK